MENKEEKMTLDDYIEKYTKNENTKLIKTGMFLFEATIGVIIFVCLFFIVLKLFDIHQYAGYVGCCVAAILFLCLYIIPIVRLHKTKAFMTNVDRTNAKKAQKYNKELRYEIADKMIDVTNKTDGDGWYNKEKIGTLAIAIQSKNDKDIKACLTNIYETDVRTSSNKLIRDYAIKVGLATALSQSEALDTLLVVTYELTLIKKLVYLYGYRPSDAKLVKIYRQIIINSLIAYGASSVTGTVTTGIVKTMGKVGSMLPLVGTLIESASQGIINSTMTVIIGFQTKKYLTKEYHLQDMLDNIDLSALEEEDEQELMASVSEEMKAKEKQKKPKLQTA